MFAIVPLGKKGSTGIPIFTILISVVCIIVHVFVSSEADLLSLFFYCFSRTIETQITAVGYLLSFVVFVLVTNLTFAITATSNIPTVGLSGVVWGYMGMFLLRYPKDDINCFVWFI